MHRETRHDTSGSADASEATPPPVTRVYRRSSSRSRESVFNFSTPAFVILVRYRFNSSRFVKPGENLKACIGDIGAQKIQLPKILQILQMNDPGIADFRAIQIQFRECTKIFQNGNPSSVIIVSRA